ncbi:hypothetical protein RHIZ404_210053 [Rhizobium sp. EC-SD404]|nr:hypothetical protein RHIZ404_210053 [Rhizobium sp. EC-SD404]
MNPIKPPSRCQGIFSYLEHRRATYKKATAASAGGGFGVSVCRPAQQSLLAPVDAVEGLRVETDRVERTGARLAASFNCGGAFTQAAHVGSEAGNAVTEAAGGVHHLLQKVSFTVQQQYGFIAPQYEWPIA